MPGDPARRARIALFAIGLAIALSMLWRCRVAGDALALLTRGWLLAGPGIWVPFGNPVASTTGGQLPGGFTALLVGGPLFLWMDHRAAVLLVLVSHVVAYLLLDRVVGRALGTRARVLLVVFYWLNPWQLYQSGWLDNPNYVFLTGALHIWATYRQRRAPSWLHSTLLVAAVGLTAQLHLCAALLVIASVLLWLRGYWKPHWWGVGLGTAITLASLIPFMAEAARHPEILPGDGRNPWGWGLLQVWPVLKGIVYWFRYGSLAASSGMNAYDFTPGLGVQADRVLAPLFTSLGRVVAWLTVIPSVLASLWTLRRQRRLARSLRPAEMSARAWLRGYAVWVFSAGFVANALSSTAIMWWHNLILVHAAVLPLVLWTDVLLRTRRAPRVRRAIAAWTASGLVLLVGMAIGAEQYRDGGRQPRAWVLHRDDQAVRDLRLTERGISIDPLTGCCPLNNDYLYQKYMRPFELPPREER